MSVFDKILIVSKNHPEINADLEIKRIQSALAGVDGIEVIAPRSLEPGEVVTQIRTHDPTVLHFISHGALRKSKTVPIVLLSSAGGAEQDLDLAQLSAYLRELADEESKRIKCVFLNACYVGVWAEKMLDCVDVVIGTKSALPEQTAQHFAAKFYEHVALGCSLEQAYRDAKHATKLDAKGGEEIFMVTNPGVADQIFLGKPGPRTQVSGSIPDELAQLHGHPTPLILYVGPELATAAGLPSRRELALRLLAALPSDISETRRALLTELCAAADLTDAFTELQRDLGTQRFGNIIADALDDSKRKDLPELAVAIGRLRARIQGVITPNLDNLLNKAFKGELIPRHTVDPGLAHDRDWLLQIHGTRELRSSWVLTREQRDRAVYLDTVLGEVFRALFMSHSILFIGAPVDDPITAEVIARVRALAIGGRAPRHWALLPRAEAGPVTRMKLEEAGITVIPFESEAERIAYLELLSSSGGD